MTAINLRHEKSRFPSGPVTQIKESAESPGETIGTQQCYLVELYQLSLLTVLYKDSWVHRECSETATCTEHLE